MFYKNNLKIFIKNCNLIKISLYICQNIKQINMNYFKQQKELQEGIENYFIPASVETIERLTEKSLALLKSIKEMQSRIDESVNFINGDSPFKNEQKDNAELETRVRAKQRLLTSYKKVLEEINKQVSSL